MLASPGYASLVIVDGHLATRCRSKLLQFYFGFSAVCNWGLLCRCMNLLQVRRIAGTELVQGCCCSGDHMLSVVLPGLMVVDTAYLKFPREGLSCFCRNSFVHVPLQDASNDDMCDSSIQGHISFVSMLPPSTTFPSQVTDRRLQDMRSPDGRLVLC